MKNLILILVLCMTGALYAQVSMEIGQFSKIAINSDANIEIKYAPEAKIQYSGSQASLDQMMTANEGMLTISGDAPNSRIRIFTRDLQAIKVSGKSNVTVNGFSSLNQLSVDATEDAKLDLGSTRINTLSINQKGNSEVIATGAGKKSVIKNGMLVSSK